MNNFTPKYIKMASQYLQESLDDIKQKEKIEEVQHPRIEKKNSIVNKLIDWIRN